MQGTARNTQDGIIGLHLIRWMPIEPGHNTDTCPSLHHTARRTSDGIFGLYRHPIRQFGVRCIAEASFVRSILTLTTLIYFCINHEDQRCVFSMKMKMKMNISIVANSSEGRGQRRNPSLSNSKEESREISIHVVTREPGRIGSRAGMPDQRNTF